MLAGKKRITSHWRLRYPVSIASAACHSYMNRFVVNFTRMTPWIQHASPKWYFWVLTQGTWPRWCLHAVCMRSFCVRCQRPGTPSFHYCKHRICLGEKLRGTSTYGKFAIRYRMIQIILCDIRRETYAAFRGWPVCCSVEIWWQSKCVWSNHILSL